MAESEIISLFPSRRSSSSHEHLAGHKLWKLAATVVAFGMALDRGCLVPSPTDLARQATAGAVAAAVQKGDCMLSSVANQPVHYGSGSDPLQFKQTPGGDAMVRLGSVGANGTDGTVSYRLRTTDLKTGESGSVDSYNNPVTINSKSCAAEILKMLNPSRSGANFQAAPTTSPSGTK